MEGKVEVSTLCYLEKDGKYLMLHRTAKEKDVNKGKWIGVGGHAEAKESPEDCILREVWEETGYHLTSYQYRGILTFVYGDDVTEYISLFTADVWEGEPHLCDEGDLEWVEKEKIWDLNLWEGDRIFLRLLEEQKSFFSLKLVYDRSDILKEAVLDGKSLELFDVRTEDGEKTGQVRERGVAHRDGTPHATAHIWIVRENQKSGYDLLLQKRSWNKDSNPGCYDISSAGHVSAGDEYLPAACREMQEELGIRTTGEDLELVGYKKASFSSVFYGKPFHDREICAIYIYRKPICAEQLQLQQEEVESVCWMDFQECKEAVEKKTLKNCIYLEELEMIENYLWKLNKKEI